MSEKTFGLKIRELRLSKTNYSLRQFAFKLGISPTYLSDIEKDRRTPPKEETIIKMAELLGVDSNSLLALADKTPPEVQRAFLKNEVYIKKVPQFLKTATASNLSSEDWDELIELIKEKKEGV